MSRSFRSAGTNSSHTEGVDKAPSPKLAFLVSRFPCLDETFILREMAALAEAGFDFDIYTLKPPDDRVVQAQAQKLLPRLIHRPFFLSWEVWRAQFYFLLRRPLRYAGAVLTFFFEVWRKPVSLAKNLALFPKAVCFARIMLQRQTVHMHAFWATFPCGMAWIAHRLTDLPYSLSAHAHDIYEDDSMLVRKLRAATFVMTCTDYNRAHLSQLVPEKSAVIKLIYHGLELNSFYEDAQARTSSSGALHMLSIGTLYKTKGFDTLIAACAALKHQNVAFECKIVGDGPERQHLLELITQHDLQKEVKLLGYLKQEELRPLRLWANVFILLPRPYLHWGIPNVYIEALATKLPVIATPLNAINELIQPEHTGILVDCDDPSAAAAALMRMWREPEHGARMALAGQKLVVQKFDAQRTALQVIDMFAKSVGWEPERAYFESKG